MRVQTEAFDPGVLLSAFCRGRTDTGAVVSFTGLARAASRTAVDRLELQAYAGFTEVGDRSRQAEARAAASACRTLLKSSTAVGLRSTPGEAIVFVAGRCAAHRRAALRGRPTFLMDYLKSRARRFWKKEHDGPDGARWIEPTARDL